MGLKWKRVCGSFTHRMFQKHTEQFMSVLLEIKQLIFVNKKWEDYTKCNLPVQLPFPLRPIIARVALTRASSASI